MSAYLNEHAILWVNAMNDNAKKPTIRFVKRVISNKCPVNRAIKKIVKFLNHCLTLSIIIVWLISF